MTSGKRVAAVLAAFMALAAPHAAGELKVAVLDSIRAMQQSEEFLGFVETFKRELEPDQKALQTIQDEIAALEQRLRDEAEVMADAERRRILKDVENKKIDLEFGSTKFQKAAQDRQTDKLQQMSQKLQAIVLDLVELERYDLVFDRRNVSWVNPRHDITAKVTEKLNERFAEGQDSAATAE